MGGARAPRMACRAGDRGNPGGFWACIGYGVACTLCTNGDAEAGGKDRPRPWQGINQGEGWRPLGVLGASCIEGGDHRQGATEWGNEGVPQEGLGSEDARSGGHGSGPLEGLAA